MEWKPGISIQSYEIDLYLYTVIHKLTILSREFLCVKYIKETSRFSIS